MKLLAWMMLPLSLCAAYLQGVGLLRGTIVELPADPERIAAPLEAALLHAMDKGVPTSWVLQTAWVESHLDSGMVGAAGELGMFQIHPRFSPQAKTEYDRALVAVNLIADYRAMYHGWEMVRLAYRWPEEAARRARR